MSVTRPTKFNPDVRNRLMYYMNSGNENLNVFYYIQPNGEVEVISNSDATRQQKMKITNVVKNVSKTYKRVTTGFNQRLGAFGRAQQLPIGMNSEELQYDVSNVFSYPAAYTYLDTETSSVNTQLQSFVNYVKANPGTDARQAVRTAGIIESEAPDTAGSSENTRGSSSAVVIVDNTTTGPSGVDVSLQTAVETARRQETEQARQQLEAEAVKQEAGQPIRTNFVKDTQQRIDLTVATGSKPEPDPLTLPSGIAGERTIAGVDMIEPPRLSANPLLAEDIATEEVMSVSSGSSGVSSLRGFPGTSMSKDMTEEELFERLKKRIEIMNTMGVTEMGRDLQARAYLMSPEEREFINEFLSRYTMVSMDVARVKNTEELMTIMKEYESEPEKNISESMRTKFTELYKKYVPRTGMSMGAQAAREASMERESRRTGTLPSDSLTEPSGSVKTTEMSMPSMGMSVTESDPSAGLETVSEFASVPGSMDVEQQTVASQAPMTTSGATVAARNLNDGLLPKFHKEAIIVFFNSDTQPNWDPELEKNIVKADYEQPSALKVMKHIVETEGASILVDKVITNASSTKEDVIIELNEILQLHFSLHRNMSRGPRIPKVGISLASLVGNMPGATQPIQPTMGPETTTEENIEAANLPVQNTIVPGRVDNSGSETAEDTNLQPLTTVTNGVSETGINLSNEYLNSAHFLGATNHGPRFLDSKPRGMQIHPIGKIDRSGYIPSTNIPGPVGAMGPQRASMQLRTKIKMCAD